MGFSQSSTPSQQAPKRLVVRPPWAPSTISILQMDKKALALQHADETTLLGLQPSWSLSIHTHATKRLDIRLHQ